MQGKDESLAFSNLMRIGERTKAFEVADEFDLSEMSVGEVIDVVKKTFTQLKESQAVHFLQSTL